MKRDRYPMPGKPFHREKTRLMNTTIKVHELEIMHPGVAFTWDSSSTGLRIVTNLTAKDINNRDKNCLFKSDAAVWAWALRVAKAQG